MNNQFIKNKKTNKVLMDIEAHTPPAFHGTSGQKGEHQKPILHIGGWFLLFFDEVPQSSSKKRRRRKRKHHHDDSSTDFSVDDPTEKSPPSPQDDEPRLIRARRLNHLDTVLLAHDEFNNVVPQKSRNKIDNTLVHYPVDKCLGMVPDPNGGTIFRVHYEGDPPHDIRDLDINEAQESPYIISRFFWPKDNKYREMDEKAKPEFE